MSRCSHHVPTSDNYKTDSVDIGTGMDHVANLIEIHMHAMYLSANQIMVDAGEVADEPLAFLRHIHNHRVSYTFAPNFFLAKLVKSIAAAKDAEDSKYTLSINFERHILTTS